MRSEVIVAAAPEQTPKKKAPGAICTRRFFSWDQ
jgi:hypothetical protein